MIKRIVQRDAVLPENFKNDSLERLWDATSKVSVFEVFLVRIFPYSD